MRNTITGDRNRLGPQVLATPNSQAPAPRSAPLHCGVAPCLPQPLQSRGLPFTGGAASVGAGKGGVRRALLSDSALAVWSSATAAVVCETAEAGVLLVEMKAGNALQLQNPKSPYYVLFMGLHGSTTVQSEQGIELTKPGRIELRLVSAPLTFRAGLESRGIFVLLPHNTLRLKGRPAGVCYSTSARRILSASLNPGEGSLPARLLHECLAGIAAQMEERQDVRQIARSGALVGELLRQAIAGEAYPGDSPKGHSGPWYVTAVERLMQDRITEPVSLVDLARTAGVSSRTLHDGFRKHRGASPMKVLREQRMQMVRQELLAPEEWTSVTDSALKWGFNHLGRFSSYYLAQFGEKPSETLRLARLKRHAGREGSRAALAS